MKILAVCQYYHPEPFRISDICEELVRRGHEVTVVTGVPNYPEGKIYPEYKNGKRRRESLNGVEVVRTFTVARGHGPVRRILNYYSYPFSSKRFVSKLDPDYDVVFVNQLSPVMMAECALKYKKKHGSPVLLYCLDLWPESLSAGGVGNGGVVYRHFHKVSARIYRACDKILVSSKSFVNYFKREFDISEDKLSHLPQYAEAIFTPDACKKAEDGNTDIMFAGNVGKAQDLETVLRAAKLTLDVPDLKWHIVGDGADEGRLKALVKEQGITERVIFHGRHPASEMPSFYRMADAMLVTLCASSLISETLPGKVQTYMAAGKAIIGAINGETKDVINEAECGYCSPSGDAEALAQNVRLFCEEKSRTRYGENAYKYYLEHFEKDRIITELEKSLSEI